MKGINFWLFIASMIVFQVLTAITLNQYENNKIQKRQSDKRLKLETEKIQIEKSKIADLTKIITTIENHYRKPKEYAFKFPPIISEDADDISSYYGYRNDPLRENSGSIEMKYHPALDLTGVKGARLQSIGNGVIENKWYPEGWHNGRWYEGHKLFNGYVQIRLENGWLASYGHITDIIIHEKNSIKAGEVFARISSNIDDMSTGRHAHFSLQDEQGNFLQPQKYIDFSQ